MKKKAKTNLEAIVQDSHIVIANKILKDREVQQIECDEQKCGEIFISPSVMTFQCEVQTKEIQKGTQMVALENDGNIENETANRIWDILSRRIKSQMK